MKKIILSAIVLLVAFSTTEINANNDDSKDNPKTNKVSTISISNINSFCKLIQRGDYDAIQALIKSGDDVNLRSNGLTPLMFAARHNKSDIAQLLIGHGARVEAKAEGNKITALEWAKRSKATDAYKVIEKAMEK